MVQVKSETDQKQLDEYIQEFNSWKLSRLFYVYHTQTGSFALETDNSKVTLIGPGNLSSMVIKAGLVDWLMEKVG